MLDQLITNQIDSSTDVTTRNILETNENQPLLNILLPKVLERLLVTESILHLDRSPEGFNGLPPMKPDSFHEVTRAIIVNDRNKFVYQQINKKNRPGLAFYDNGVQISNSLDVEFPIDHQDSITEVTMRRLLTAFFNSTIKRLDTLPATPVLTQPGFRFISQYSGNTSRTEHLAIASVNPNYWQ